MNWPATELGLQPAWYCVRTHPKHEHIAAGSLSSRLGLEVFNPRLRIERATRRGPVRVIEPVFPGYIFVRCQLEERVDQVRYVNGVSGLVHFGNRIPAIPDDTIEELRQCFGYEDALTAEEQLQVGTEVVVAAGALLGSRGIVVRVLPARQRVQVLMDFLGRATVAEIDRSAVTVEDQSLADLMPALALPRLAEAVAA